MRGPHRGRYSVEVGAVQGADAGREERGILAVGQAQSEQSRRAGQAHLNDRGVRVT